MWNKGALVIIKRGDEAMANAMASPFEQEKNDISDEEYKHDKAWKDLLSKKKNDDILLKIAAANEKYDYNWVPPKWAKKIVEGFAFVVYKVCVFIDKYLVIREENSNGIDRK